MNPTDGRWRPDSNVPERIKELDFEQRSRLLGTARATLSLSLLRRWLRQFWTRTLPAGASRVPRPPRGSVAVTFVGHATVMLTTSSLRVITDPMLDGSLCGLPRARMPAIDDDDLDDVGLVLISHAHRDHLSRKTLARMPRGATIVVPSGCANLVGDLGLARVVELSVGQAHHQDGVAVTAVPARHSGRRGVLDRKRRGANGYIIEVDGRCIYFAGDTGYFAGFLEIGRRFAPEVALLPIAGYQPASFRGEHLSPLDALYAFEDLRARALVPIGYGSFQLSYERLHEPLAWLREAARERGHDAALTVLAHGQTCVIRATTSHRGG